MFIRTVRNFLTVTHVQPGGSCLAKLGDFGVLSLEYNSEGFIVIIPLVPFKATVKSPNDLGVFAHRMQSSQLRTKI